MTDSKDSPLVSDNTVLFQTLAESTSAAIFIVQDQKICYANPTARVITGFKPEELSQMEFWQLAAPSYQEVIRQYGMGNPWAEDIPIRYELKLQTVNGEERWVDLTAARIDLAGQDAMLVTAFDITDRDQAERALRQSKDELEGRVIERTQALQDAHQRLQTVLRALPVAVWLADAEGRIIEKNAMADVVWGIDTTIGVSGPGRPGFVAWWAETGKPVRPEEWGLSRAIRLGETSTGEVIDILRFDGKPATLLSSSAPIYDAEGRRSGAVMVQQDITAERQLERQEARRANEMNAILDAMVESVVVYGADGVTLWANPAALAMYGFSPVGMQREEIIRRCDMRDDQGQPMTPERMPATRALKGETVTQERIRISRPRGGMRTVMASASPLQSEGHITGVVVLLSDITESVHQEQRAGRSITRAQKVASLSQAFAGAGLDTSAVVATVSHQIAELSGDACLLYLISDEDHSLQVAAFSHPNQAAADSFLQIASGMRQRLDEGVAGEVFQSGEAVLVMNFSSEEVDTLLTVGFRDWVEQNPVRSGLFVPLRTQAQKLGVLGLLRYQGELPYTVDDQVFFQDLADRASLAIENSKLYAREIDRTRELEALYKVTSSMLTNLDQDLDSLLGQILDAAQLAIPAAEQGSLHLIERQTGQLEVRAAQVFHDLRIQKVSLPQIAGYLARAVLERQPLLIHDYPVCATPPQPPALDGEGGSPRPVRSAIIAPLLLGDQLLGVLSLVHSEPGRFDLSDLRLLRSFAATATTAIQNNTLYSEVERLATTDTLTGLLNRRRFYELGEVEIDRFNRFGHPLSAIMLDVDDLKQTNDTYGHSTGDSLLQSLADRCRAVIRRVDIMGRYGGDEFAILLPETSLDKAIEVAERLRCAIETDGVWSEQGKVSASASLGVATAGEQTHSITDLIRCADEALYRAKQKGRNRVETL